jgi:hypothetical protein
MKILSILSLFFFFSGQCCAQSLHGEWQGSFTGNYSGTKEPIALYFILQKDRSYKVYSYSKGMDYFGNEFTAVCEVLYKKTGVDSMYLEEVKQIKPKRELHNCFQKMYLKVKANEKGILILEGKWETPATKECSGFGTISFTKK